MVDLDCFSSLYADDAKLGIKVTSIEDCVKLQICLDKLLQWSLSWGMQFNVSKCKSMSVAKIIF